MTETPHRYRIVPKNPGAHLFEVTLVVERPAPDGQVISLPAWIPGSYLIRDFARHVVSMRAYAGDRELALTRPDKSSWQAEACGEPITFTAEILAAELSVRGAHLDTTHACFNGPCVFPKVIGQAGTPCEIEIAPPPDAVGRDWRVATSMRPLDAAAWSFGTYRADSYDELIDHPVEIGNLLIGEFVAGGIPHAIAVRGHTRLDMARVCHDLAKLCEQHQALLGAPRDMDRYLFLLLVLPEGYGGLEHRWSSSLACSRGDLPLRGESGVKPGYRKFLGLCSHEYFHLWNVKRMRPARFTPYDLRAEAYTGLLWVFEGITSYYDDLALARAGLITRESYLDLLARTMTRVVRALGRFRQSVEESSFDAWTKFYRQDAHSSNTIVSYYTKGALIALALDFRIRRETNHASSLDAVMQECWRRFGETGEGMPERALESVAQAVTGLDLREFFERYVRGTTDLPLHKILAEFGIVVHERPSEGGEDAGGRPASPDFTPVPWLGLQMVAKAGKELVSVVHAGSPAEKAGLSPGDEVLALDGVRWTAAGFEARLREHHVGDRVTVSVFRRDELMSFRARLGEAPADTIYLEIDPQRSEAAARNLDAWLAAGSATRAPS